MSDLTPTEIFTIFFVLNVYVWGFFVIECYDWYCKRETHNYLKKKKRNEYGPLLNEKELEGWIAEFEKSGMPKENVQKVVRESLSKKYGLPKEPVLTDKEVEALQKGIEDATANSHMNGMNKEQKVKYMKKKYGYIYEDYKNERANKKIAILKGILYINCKYIPNFIGGWAQGY